MFRKYDNFYINHLRRYDIMTSIREKSGYMLHFRCKDSELKLRLNQNGTICLNSHTLEGNYDIETIRKQLCRHFSSSARGWRSANSQSMSGSIIVFVAAVLLLMLALSTHLTKASPPPAACTANQVVTEHNNQQSLQSSLVPLEQPTIDLPLPGGGTIDQAEDLRTFGLIF